MNDFELEQELKELVRKIASNPRRRTSTWTILFFEEMCKEKGTIGKLDITFYPNGGVDSVSA